MIQRIQTLFMLQAILFLALFLFSPVFHIEQNGAFSVLKAWDNLNFSIPSFLIIVGLLINIFLYNKRPLQIKILWRLLVANIALLVIIFLEFNENKNSAQIYHIAYGFYFPIATFVSIILAIYRVKHDEKLVRSADRLR